MMFVPALIPGVSLGLEFYWPDEDDPLTGVIIHFFIFRFMFFWGFPDEQQFPPSD